MSVLSPPFRSKGGEYLSSAYLTRGERISKVSRAFVEAATRLF
jgi:hypothetical protein